MLTRWFLGISIIAACGGSSGNPGGGPDAPPAAHSGGAGLAESHPTNPGATVNTSAFAAFDGGPNECTTMDRMGPCYVQHCDRSMAMYVSAGAITISGGAGQPISLVPDASNRYSPFSMPAELFPAGQTINLAASGATAPAYTASVTMPGQVTITSPAKPAGSLAVTRSQDFTITWSSQMTDIVEVSASSNPDPNTELVCAFPAAAGSGTVPAALLAMLPAGMGGMSVTSWETVQNRVNDWSLFFSVFRTGLWPDGTTASIQATYN
jgi:hypothetical protein